MFVQLVQSLQDQVHASAIGSMPWVAWFADNLIDLLTSPFTGLRTRSYWPELIASLLIAGLLFMLRVPRASRGLREFLKFCFPSSMWRHRSTWVDWQIIVLNQFFARSFNVTWRITGALLAGVLVTAMTRIFGPSPHLLTWTTTTLYSTRFCSAWQTTSAIMCSIWPRTGSPACGRSTGCTIRPRR